MSGRRVAQHIRALRIAKECAALGARIRTIQYVTGIPPRQVRRLFFSDRPSDRRGRPHASPDWYDHAKLLSRAEASVFLSVYQRIRNLGFDPMDALVHGYQRYLHVCAPRPRVDFDRAFDLASHLEGVWVARNPSFQLASCPVCMGEHVAPVVMHVTTNEHCPFCKLVRRYDRDERLQAALPGKPVPDSFNLSAGGLVKHLSSQRSMLSKRRSGKR